MSTMIGSKLNDGDINLYNSYNSYPYLIRDLWRRALCLSIKCGSLRRILSGGGALLTS